MSKTALQLVEELAIARQKADIERAAATELEKQRQDAERRKFWQPIVEAIQDVSQAYPDQVTPVRWSTSLHNSPQFNIGNYVYYLNRDSEGAWIGNGAWSTSKTADVASLMPSVLNILANALKGVVK